jgi:hypothetical protein
VVAFFKFVAGLIVLIAVGSIVFSVIDSRPKPGTAVVDWIKFAMRISTGPLIQLCYASILLVLLRIYRYQTFEDEVQ